MPQTVRLDVADNRFQRVETIRRNRVKRGRYGEFLVEGVRPINRAVEAGWRFRSYWYSGGIELSDWAKDRLAGSQADFHFELSDELFRRLTDKEDPPELLAVVETRPDSLERIQVDEGLCVVVFDRGSSPGNLGTLIRSADGLGASGVVVCGHAADIYDPATVRASMGSLFSVPVIEVASAATVIDWIAATRAKVPSLAVVGLDPAGGSSLADAVLTGPVVVVVGNETFGLSRAWKEACDMLAGIPMVGSADSLNAAVSGSIALYEVMRQRVGG